MSEASSSSSHFRVPRAPSSSSSSSSSSAEASSPEKKKTMRIILNEGVEIYFMDVGLDSTIGEIRPRLSALINQPGHRIHFVLNGVELADDDSVSKVDQYLLNYHVVRPEEDAVEVENAEEEEEKQDSEKDEEEEEAPPADYMEAVEQPMADEEDQQSSGDEQMDHGDSDSELERADAGEDVNLEENGHANGVADEEEEEEEEDENL